MTEFFLRYKFLTYPLLTIFIGALTIFLTYYLFNKFKKDRSRLIVHLILTFEVFICLFLIIVSLPLRDALKGQILSFLGVLLSATIAISSTAILGNIMAGLMLKSINPLKVGDFIKTDDHFGRISERGLFHIEIQTEDRNLVTIPNNYLILKPVKVIHSKGTIISSEVSLGYDIPWEQVRKLLILAAKNSGLEDPFVHTITLGDFSIGYRVSGLLSEVKYLITAKSHLNNEILATLHKNAIEIVSPNFMNTRAVNDITFIPVKTLKKEAESTEELPEETIFEKADMAEKIEADTQHLSDLQDKIKELKKLMDSSENKDDKVLRERMILLKNRESKLLFEIEKSKELLDENK